MIPWGAGLTGGSAIGTDATWPPGGNGYDSSRTALFTAVPLTGGTGTGAQAQIQVTATESAGARSAPPWPATTRRCVTPKSGSSSTNKPIASHQLVQEKLVWMITEITKAQFLALQVGQLKDQGASIPRTFRC